MVTWRCLPGAIESTTDDGDYPVNRVKAATLELIYTKEKGPNLLLRPAKPE